eukprot:981408-Rhodomonas_salina.1
MGLERLTGLRLSLRLNQTTRMRMRNPSMGLKQLQQLRQVAEEAGLTSAEGSAEDAFYTMAADLHQTLDEIKMERRAPSPVQDRRSEMTPGRVVHFEPVAMSPDHRESKLGFGDRLRQFSMSPLTST